MAKKTNTEINGNRYFRVTKTIGHRADGTPIRKQFYGSGINEAEAKAIEYINNLKSGLIDGNKILTINILLPKWLFNIKKNEIKPSTLESYEGTYRNFIKPNIIADIPINDIKTLKIQEYYNEMKTSDNNVKKTHKLLNQFFSYAEKDGYILKNPCNNVTLPKRKKTVSEIIENKQKFQYFSEAEILKLKDVFKGNKYEKVILFALGTGMRRGEIFGLQWSDIDFKTKRIHVIHNLSIIASISLDGTRKYNLELQTPKTENSIRVIPMSDNIYKLLYSMEKRLRFCFCSK